MNKADQLIADYIAAYKACNEKSEPPRITYKNGWFHFRSSLGPSQKYRRRTLEEMMGRLVARAKGEETWS